MPEATLPEAPAAAAPDAPEFVTLVNVGKAPYQLAAGKTLLPNSQNTQSIPKALALELMKRYPTLKDASSIFPDAVNTDALKKQNEDLKRTAEALQKLLSGSDAAKAKAAEAFAAEKANAVAEWTKVHDALKAEIAALGEKVAAAPAVAAFEAKIADLEARLRDFLGAGSKKDLDALQEKHADAVPAVAA